LHSSQKTAKRRTAITNSKNWLMIVLSLGRSGGVIANTLHPDEPLDKHVRTRVRNF